MQRSPSKRPTKTEIDTGPKLILVKSIDFDGCIFHAGYIVSKSRNRLLETNAEFIKSEALRMQREGYDEAHFINGSYRQDYVTDFTHGKWANKGSSYSALDSLAAAFQKAAPTIPCRRNNHLLADMYGNKPAGENFENALQRKHGTYPFSKWVHDESKLTLTYAQMHKFASENKQSNIVYELIDDDEDVLDGLAKLYAQHSDLIPHNVALRFRHYNGGVVKNHGHVIQGIGEIDDNYHENVKLMVACIGKNPGTEAYFNKCNVAVELQADQDHLLNQFKQERKLTVEYDKPADQQPDMSMEESERLVSTDENEKPDAKCLVM